MFLKNIGMLLLLVIAGLVAPMSLADTPGTRAIANVLYHFNHFPTQTAKQSLLRIAQDPGSSEGEKIVAQALARAEHKVKAEDIAAMQQLLDDTRATDEIRALARMLLQLNHKPSDEDQATLKAML
jgi:hypothetical protein